MLKLFLSPLLQLHVRILVPQPPPEDHPAQPNGAPLRSARLEVSGDLLQTGAVVRGYPVTLGDCVTIKPDNTVSSLKTEELHWVSASVNSCLCCIAT